MSKKKFYIESQEVGDIILISNKACSSRLQKLFQSLFSLKISRYSHVILALNKGTYIEAMKGNKENNKYDIDLFCIKELKQRFKYEYYDNWRVIRYKGMNQELRNIINKYSNYFYGQNYNSNPIRKIVKPQYKIDSSYCSELVQRIYEKAGINIGCSKKDIWPVHIDNLTKNINEWEDVTELYSRKPSKLHVDIFYNKSCKKNKNIQKIIHENYKNLIEFDQSTIKFSNYLNSKKFNLEIFPKVELEELSKTFKVNKTFNSVFIDSLIKKYSMLHSNSMTFPIDISYQFEKIKDNKLHVDFTEYDNLLMNTILTISNTLSLLISYINSLIENTKNHELKKELNIIIQKIPTYTNDELTEGLKSLSEYKDNNNDNNLEKHYDLIEILVKLFKLVNLCIDNDLWKIEENIDKKILLNLKDKINEFIEIELFHKLK